MAVSSSRNFELDVAEIIEEAYERCGKTMKTGYDAQTARRSLNLMFADWANRGINLWTVNLDTSTTLVADQTQVTLAADVVDLLEVVVRRSSTDYPVQRISRGEYQGIANKASTGRPTVFWLDRQILPVINLWPASENATDVLRYYYVRRIQDADTMVNTNDMPFRFYPAMVSGLAYMLALKKAPDRLQLLKPIYEEEFQRAADEDRERVPLRLVPGRRR